MSHIKRLEEIRVQLQEDGQNASAIKLGAVIADMKAERVVKPNNTIMDQVVELNDMNEMQPSFDDSGVSFDQEEGAFKVNNDYYDLVGEVIKDNMSGVK